MACQIDPTLSLRRTLVAVSMCALAACSSEPEQKDGPLPQRVLLISLDTLRADHTGFGGYSKPTTPFLDSLAERAVVFDNHFANSNCTLPSHATMLTGLHYPSHGVRPTGEGEPIRVIPQSALTMAERFQDAGFSTSAFTSHGSWLNAEHGFDQGFDHFVSRWCDADRTIKDYLTYIDETPSEKSFAFLHFFDIHSDFGKSGPCTPYKSTGELMKQFAGELPAGFTGCSSVAGRESICCSNYLQEIENKVEPLVDEHLKYIIGLYDAGIRLMDDKLRALFAELERRGQLENTLVVITADHGESFYEHKTMLHNTHHDEVAKVPMILLLPETSGVAPRRIKALTQSTDLAAMMLDLCGLDQIGQVPSLAPAVMLNEEVKDGVVLFHGHITVGRDEVGEYKYIKIGGRVPSLLHDRTADPAESHDLLSDEQYKLDQAERIARIHQEQTDLTNKCKDILKGLESLDSGTGGEMSAETLENLKGLGYFGGLEPDKADLPKKDAEKPATKKTDGKKANSN